MRQVLEDGSQRLKCLMIVATNPYPPVSGGQRQTLSELETYSRFMDIDLLAFHDVTQPQVPDQMKKHLAHLCRSVGLCADFAPLHAPSGAISVHPATLSTHRASLQSDEVYQ
jgi:hypothetical protein